MRDPARCERVLLLFLVVFATAASGYEEGPVRSGGTVSGRIIFSGRPPPLREIHITKDPAVCGITRDNDVILVSKTGGVANVVVYLLDVPAGKAWTENLEPVLDQQHCHYVPRVQIVRQHSTLQVRSADPVLHNVHSFLNGATFMNFAVPPRKGLVLRQRLDKPGGMQLKCDVHAFMRGGIFVATNPYHALTDAEGRYSITDVPPGQYTIATWHEEAGLLSETITLPAGGAVAWNGRVR